MADRTPVSRRVDFGEAELVPDHTRPMGWRLLVDGVPQSYVDLTHPGFLDFEYVRRLASVVDAAAPPREPLRVLHLGGGALTLPRYVHATRPGSPQLVVDRDAALMDLVRSVLPLPGGADVTVETADARVATEKMVEGTATFDVVLGDVFHGAQAPPSVNTVEFAGLVARLLAPLGCYAVNVADLPPLAFTRRVAATLRAAFTDVCMIAEPRLLRGRRYGNVVLVATAHRAGLPITRLARAAALDPFPSRVLHGGELRRFVGGAEPLTDAEAVGSPPPPSGRLL